MTDKRLTLYELNNLVREVIECEMPNEYWEKEWVFGYLYILF